MTVADTANKRLQECLLAELQALRDFCSTLEAEQNALSSGDINAITTLSQSKPDQVEKLNRLATDRIAQLSAIGFTGNQDGMRLWVEHAGKVAKEAWHELIDLAAAAQRINQLNGKLIQTHLQHNQQALSALLQAANQAGLYGPDGHARSVPESVATGRGIIGKA